MREAPQVLVNIERLKADIESLAQIGRDPRGGLSRPSFSPADREARAWLKGRIEDAGLAYRRDGAGNIFGRLGDGSPVVLAGSHIDTVINGGKFDGAAGVLAALECLRRIKEEGGRLARPLELVAFTDEEGSLVGDFLGSRAFAGRLNRREVERGATSLGSPLADILADTGITAESILGAHEERPDVAAYLELHIEQGSALETEGASLGIVERIAGKRYRWCSYLGKADHGGTTPLDRRRDAFLATADFALRATRIVATHHAGGLMTVGKVAVQPGSFSVVPGRVDFSLDLRSDSPKSLQHMDEEILAFAGEVAATRGLAFRSRLVDATEPVSLSGRVIAVLKEEAAGLGYAPLMLTSGAGHDAQIVSSIADAGLIFIPCAHGISHSPEEKIGWDDLEKGANLLLRALIRLAS
jgi:N-carbamoyl-L-amino-acid hydrolase